MLRILFLFFIASLISCAGQSVEKAAIKSYSTVHGETMGTYYRASYSDTINVKEDLDSILMQVNMSVSTYINTSEISRFNQTKDSFLLAPGIFKDNFLIAKEFFDLSDGFYDPTVMPLVNYWGFGYAGKNAVEKVDSNLIKEISSYIGFDKISSYSHSDSLLLVKGKPKVELDFSSVAKGYAVDEIAKFLEMKSITDFLVDIGGEMRMKGKNPKGSDWSIGINTPQEDASLTESIKYIRLADKSIATSGNYRNFYEAGGKKISHTINPITGFPERSKLLGVSIISDDCAHADAWATTCMVMGLDRSVEILKEHNDIDALLVYNNDGELDVVYVNNFESYIIE